MSDSVTLSINGKRVSAKPGTKILFAALDNGIDIPNLCAIREAEEPHVGCRLCLVEIEGRPGLTTACSEEIKEGMVVRTDTAEIQRVRRTALELILSDHPIICSTCPANGDCDLQRLSKKLKVPLKQKRFKSFPREYKVDDSHPDIIFDHNLCVLCGKCVWVCNTKGNGVLNFAFRGMKTIVSTFNNRPLGDSICTGCLDCVALCPVGALSPRDEWEKVSKKGKNGG